MTITRAVTILWIDHLVQEKTESFLPVFFHISFCLIVKLLQHFN